MLIEQNIKLELTNINFVENPINERGKFIAYNFRMYWPLESAFFNEKWPTHQDKDLTVAWGRTPDITYYTKENRKIFQDQVLNKIKAELPEGFTIDNVTSYKLGISGYDSPRDDRKWAIWYSARYFEKGSRLCHSIDSYPVKVDNNFMSRLIALIPEKVKGKFDENKAHRQS